MKRTYQPHNLRRKRTHGLRACMASRGGRLRSTTVAAVSQAPDRQGRREITRPDVFGYAFPKAERVRKRSEYPNSRRGPQGRIQTPLAFLSIWRG